MKPQIGIWWDNGQQIIAFSMSPRKPDPATGLCDSDYSHNDQWPEAAMQFGASPDDDYFSVPRGRVKFEPATGKYIILHGNKTSASRLPLIAAKFGLTNWEARKDGHYVIT